MPFDHRCRRLACLTASAGLLGPALAADRPAPVPSGPRTDGVFHKVILDSDPDLDGCLYVLENGTAWVGNKDTQLVRIEHRP